MGGVEVSEEITTQQLEAMCGGVVLRLEVCGLPANHRLAVLVSLT